MRTEMSQNDWRVRTSSYFLFLVVIALFTAPAPGPPRRCHRRRVITKSRVEANRVLTPTECFRVLSNVTLVLASFPASFCPKSYSCPPRSNTQGTYTPRTRPIAPALSLGLANDHRVRVARKDAAANCS